jgi:DHA1 family tetracycline resistance protein-like MFS transporter
VSESSLPEAAPERPLSPPPGGRRGALAAVFLAILLDLIGFGMILPLIPFYAERFQASPLEIGLVFASYSLAQLLVAPPLGRLSDRYGRRPLMLLSIAGSVAANLMFAWATSLVMLLAARTLAGAAAGNYGIAQAYVADVTPPEKRSRAMGLVGAAFGLGFILGPALGGLLSRISLQAVPLAAAALSLVNLAIAWGALRESLPPAERRPPGEAALFDWRDLRAIWANLPLRRLMLLFFLVMFCFSIMEATLALYCKASFGWGDRETSWLFTYVGLLLVLVQGGLLGPLARRFGDRRLVLAGIALMAAGLVLLPAVAKLPWLLGSMLLLALGSGVHNPSLLALLSRLAGRRAQGETIGVSRSFGALARATGPIAGTWIFGAAGMRWPFWAAGTLMGVALWIARDLLRRLTPTIGGS